MEKFDHEKKLFNLHIKSCNSHRSNFIQNRCSYENEKEQKFVFNVGLVSESRVLPICTEGALQGDVIATCGMGSISRSTQFFPNSLFETYFTVNYLRSEIMRDFIPFHEQPKFCEDKDICTDKYMGGENYSELLSSISLYVRSKKNSGENFLKYGTIKK